MLDFAIFAVTFVIILVGAVLYLYPVGSKLALRLATHANSIGSATFLPEQC